MGVWTWVSIAVAVAAVIAWYLSYTAARLDRLHARVEGSVSALDAQLVRRAETGLELANSGLLDPASSMLLTEACAASLDESDVTEVRSEVQRHGVDRRRARIESELSETLRAVLVPEVVVELADTAQGTEVLRRVQQTAQRVQLAHRFHNDAVHDVQRVRTKPLVRIFRLAGHTLLPEVVDFDDNGPDLTGV
ncbi:hypothetical protein G9U51_14445 [Calidifontibacter sp. DB0510]|uniref:LemA family protein n=1 Tax=Metallococcus carri TaxID=1656884 RepID=A0A967B3P8_9MICO|nr:hypothetical protein [Metallococcus carri]NHN56968.1 hypothetical protein [Metallococcus carri]NOP37713.1 hypothetical protein [Calidifontibacter sp. DB2511S]